MASEPQEEDEVVANIKILRDASIATGGLAVSPREMASVRLGELGDRRAVQPLLEIFESESETDLLRSLALEALAKIGGEEVREGLMDAFRKAKSDWREGMLKMAESGKLKKTGLSRADLLGVDQEELSVVDKAEQHIKEGADYWNNRKWKEALAKWKEAASLNPDHSDVHARLGKAYIELGDIEQAETEFMKQIRVNDDEFYSHAILSIIYDARSEYSAARAEEMAAMNTSYYRMANPRLLPEYARRIADLVNKKKPL
jgi:tetratricopeptide (TPR) repeat protein